MHTLALTALATMATLTTACIADDERAEGEEVWTVGLQRLDDGGPLPTCDRLVRQLELTLLRDDAGALLGIYTPGIDQRFDTYELNESNPELIELTATQELSTGDRERWHLELGTSASDPDRMIGAAVQTIVVGEVDSCATNYAANVRVER